MSEPFTLPTPTIASLLSPAWQAAACNVYAKTEAGGVSYRLAAALANGEFWYSLTVEGAISQTHLREVASFEEAKNRARLNGYSLVSQCQRSQVCQMLTALNNGMSLRDWCRIVTDPTTPDQHHNRPADFASHAAIYRLRSEQFIAQRYWLCKSNALYFTENRSRVAVADSPLPFAQYACQVVVTDDGIHRVALLYEVNGELVTPETQLAYLASLAQYDVPTLAYQPVTTIGRGGDPVFRVWKDNLLVQVNIHGAWSSAVVA